MCPSAFLADKKTLIFSSEVFCWLERHLAKVEVAGSNPVIRSTQSRPAGLWADELLQQAWQCRSGQAAHVDGRVDHQVGTQPCLCEGSVESDRGRPVALAAEHSSDVAIEVDERRPVGTAAEELVDPSPVDIHADVRPHHVGVGDHHRADRHEPASELSGVVGVADRHEGFADCWRRCGSEAQGRSVEGELDVLDIPIRGMQSGDNRAEFAVEGDECEYEPSPDAYPEGAFYWLELEPEAVFTPGFAKVEQCVEYGRYEEWTPFNTGDIGLDLYGTPTG